MGPPPERDTDATSAEVRPIVLHTLNMGAQQCQLVSYGTTVGTSVFITVLIVAGCVL